MTGRLSFLRRLVFPLAFFKRCARDGKRYCIQGSHRLFSGAEPASDGCPVGARISGRPPSCGKRRDGNRLRSAGRQHSRVPQGLSHILHGGKRRRAWRQCSGRLKAQRGSRAPSPGRPARCVEVRKAAPLRAPGQELYFSFGTPLDRNPCRASMSLKLR